jgi:F-type H+-transporting ATPase subunit gamma
MSGLKALRIRINSVKSTQKITSAMKMVAAAKLRRAQEQAESARPYAERLEGVLRSLAANVTDSSAPLLVGTGQNKTHLVLVVSSDRGLCGAFNGSIFRAVRTHIQKLQHDGKEVKLFCIGRKARDLLARDHGKLIIRTVRDLGSGKLGYGDAQALSQEIQELFATGGFDVCTVIYNRFKSVISQEVTQQQLIPLPLPTNTNIPAATPTAAGGALYLYEPSEREIVKTLLPLNLSVQIFRALLESNASEQGARMSAMDNATRNAGDMLKGLRLTYNRTRQAMITKELIEIISGADAL